MREGTSLYRHLSFLVFLAHTIYLFIYLFVLLIKVLYLFLLILIFFYVYNACNSSFNLR